MEISSNLVAYSKNTNFNCSFQEPFPKDLEKNVEVKRLSYNAVLEPGLKFHMKTPQYYTKFLLLDFKATIFKYMLGK